MERLFALIILAALVVAGGVAIDSAGERVGDRGTVENASFTPDGTVAVQGSNLDHRYYADSATVFNNSSVVTQPGNYTWNANNGTLTVTNQSYLDNRTSANVTYRYSLPSESERAVVTMLGGITNSIGLLVFVMFVGVLAAVLRVIA